MNWPTEFDKLLFASLFLVAFITHMFYPRDFEEKVAIAILSSLTTLVVSSRVNKASEGAITKSIVDAHTEISDPPEDKK